MLLFLLRRPRSSLIFPHLFLTSLTTTTGAVWETIITRDSLEINDTLTLRRLPFWVKYTKEVHTPVFKVLQGSCWINWTTTCWKLLILLSLSSGSGIVFWKISDQSHVEDNVRQEAALQEVSGTWTCSGRHHALLLDQLLGFFQIGHVFIVLSPQILHVSQHEFHRPTHSRLLKETVYAETAFALGRPSWCACTI